MAEQDDSMEVWKAIPTWEGLYEASTFGNVRRLYKQRPPRLRKFKINHNGYLTVALIGPAKTEHWFVHRLIAITFISPKPEGKQINHKDCIKSNNRPENLEWVTPKENVQHGIANGRVPDRTHLTYDHLKGEKHYNAVLIEKDVESICNLFEMGEQNQKIAKKFGVVPTTIAAIRGGIIWRGVTKGRRFPPINRGSKITPQIVFLIRQDLENGIRTGVIAKKYGLSPTSVCDIRAGRTWAHHN